MIDLIASIIMFIGAAFCLLAAMGLLRLPDLFLRMHASTKAGTLGGGLVMAAVAIHSGEPGTIVRALGVVIFLMLTAPVAAHMIGRAAYRSGEPLAPHTICDDLAKDGYGPHGPNDPEDKRHDPV